MTWGDDTAWTSAVWGLYLLFAAVGAVVSYRAVSAYRSHRTRPLLLLAGGFVLLSIGSPVAWIAAYSLSADLVVCTAMSLLPAVAGVGALLASVQLRRE